MVYTAGTEGRCEGITVVQLEEEEEAEVKAKGEGAEGGDGGGIGVEIIFMERNTKGDATEEGETSGALVHDTQV